MKPGKMYWEFVILARKLCIVSSERRLPYCASLPPLPCHTLPACLSPRAVAVALRGSTSYQLACMLLVLFAAFAAQVRGLMGGVNCHLRGLRSTGALVNGRGEPAQHRRQAMGGEVLVPIPIIPLAPLPPGCR